MIKNKVICSKYCIPTRRTKQANHESAVMTKDCICGNLNECQGLTAGFRVLEDPRGRFVRLPRFEPNPSCRKLQEHNERRAAYLRHIEFDILPHQDTVYVAMHHFPPLMIGEVAAKKIPKTVSKEDMVQLGIEIDERDRILDEDGNPTGLYHFVPNYPIEKAREDLRQLLRICKIINTSPKKKRHSSDTNVLLDLTNESDRGSPGSEAVYVFEDSDSEEENSNSTAKKYLPFHLHKDESSPQKYEQQQSEPLLEV